MKSKKVVLVVDDEPIGYEVIEAHLYREGYDIIYAASGKEALNCLDSVEPDVILLDVMMPQMDGIEVCRHIKADPYWKHIPVITITALNSKEDLARAFEAGADDFISKPVSGIELRARVRSMLRIKKQYDALQTTLQLREDLSNMIVHDLRNPLTNILLSSDLLLQMNLEQKPQDKIQMINISARQLNSMVNDLLLLAKMESGKMVLNRVEVDLNQLVAKTLSQFEAIAQTKNQTIETRLPEFSYPIIADASLLHRVLDNLLSNAIKFSPRQSAIAIEVHYLDEAPPKQAIIRVIDEGLGVNENLQQRIFDKYEVGNTIQAVPQLGLGLAFCKMVVEAHDGKIFVESNQPKGSIFTVMI